MELDDIISKYPPKQIMLIPIAIIILALISLGATYLATGSPVKLGIEFTGGTLVTVPSTESEDKSGGRVCFLSSGGHKKHRQQIYAPVRPHERYRNMPSWQSLPMPISIVPRSGTWDRFTARSFKTRSSSTFLFPFY